MASIKAAGQVDCDNVHQHDPNGDCDSRKAILQTDTALCQGLGLGD